MGFDIGLVKDSGNRVFELMILLLFIFWDFTLQFVIGMILDSFGFSVSFTDCDFFPFYESIASVWSGIFHFLIVCVRKM